MAEHEGERPADEVTISIFRAVKNSGLFEKMERDGTLVKNETPGVYHVKGYTNLPFQIIITSELEGDEYAAYRALTDRAKKADVERIVSNAKNEKDEILLEHYGVLLDLVVEKNKHFFDLVKGGLAMKNMLLEMVKDEVEEKVQEASRETELHDIKNLMTNLKLTLEQAMDALGIPQAERATYTSLIQKNNS